MSTDDHGAGEFIFGDAGGWISGSSLGVERLEGRALGGPRFGINIGAWMKEYGPRYVLQGGFDGVGFVCWRRSGEGRPSGHPIKGDTLDQLAEWIDHRQTSEAPRQP